MIHTFKDYIILAAGAIGAILADTFGGWDSALTTLLILQFLDYITGMMVAGLFKNSPKSATGGLNSNIGWLGLAKKFVVLMFVFIASRIDLALGTAYIKDAVCIAYIVNELVSLVENAGLMGVPIPAAIMSAIDVLNDKTEG